MQGRDGPGASRLSLPGLRGVSDLANNLQKDLARPLRVALRAEQEGLAETKVSVGGCRVGTNEAQARAWNARGSVCRRPSSSHPSQPSKSMPPRNQRGSLPLKTSRKKKSKVPTYETFDEALDGGVEQEEKGERYRVGDKVLTDLNCQSS